MKKIHEYHTNIYSSKAPDRDAIEHYLDNVPVRMTQEQQEMLDAEITREELTKAIDQMNKNRSPGPDGIPVEFYEAFPMIQDDMLNLYNGIYRHTLTQPFSHTLGYMKLTLIRNYYLL